MILLASTSDEILLVTGSAVSDIYVQASWIDLSGVNLTPSRTNTIITGATSTVIVGSPASGYSRALKNLCIYNSSGAPCDVTLQHTDGTNVVDIFNYTMLAGEAIYWSEGRGFYVQDANGNYKTSITTNISPGGSNGGIQYNNNGVLAGSAATATAAGSITIPNGQELVTSQIEAPLSALAITQAFVASIYGNEPPPSIDLEGSYWTGSVAALDEWSLFPILGSGSNPSSTLKVLHTGAPGTCILDLTNFAGTGGTMEVLINNLVLNGSSSAPTQTPLNDSTTLATTAYVDQAFISGSLTKWEEDFLACGANVTVSSSGLIFTAQSPWYCGPISGGTTGTVVSTSTASFTNPGLATLTTPATIGDGIWMITGNEKINVGALGNSGITPPWYLDFWIQLGSVSNVCVRVGAFTTNEFNISPPTNGIWCEFDTANASSDTDFTLATGNGTSTNYVPSSVVPAATTWYHIRIFSTVAGTIQMVISTANGAFSAVVSSSTDVPTGGLVVGMQIVPRANTAETLIVDRVSYYGANGRA